MHSPLFTLRNRWIAAVAGTTILLSSSLSAFAQMTHYTDVPAGAYYVNIHTAQYPDGEIRGQILPQ